MSYLLKNYKWMVLATVANECAYFLSDRFYPTDLPQLLFSEIVKKKHS